MGLNSDDDVGFIKGCVSTAAKDPVLGRTDADVFVGGRVTDIVA